MPGHMHVSERMFFFFVFLTHFVVTSANVFDCYKISLRISSITEVVKRSPTHPHPFALGVHKDQHLAYYLFESSSLGTNSGTLSDQKESDVPFAVLLFKGITTLNLIMFDTFMCPKKSNVNEKMVYLNVRLL